jgi:hypothetical protein
LEEVPSSTKATTKKGRKLHFSSPSPTTSINIKKPFTISSTLKEVDEEEILPKVSVPRKEKEKGKGIKNSVVVMDRASMQHKFKDKVIEKPIEVINISTPPSNPVFKKLIRHLREARK